MIHDPRPYLYDILDSITRIRRYVHGLDETSFLKDEILQDAVVRRVEVIGEAVGRLSDALKERYPNVPWRDIKDMRNKLIHDYGHVDLELVWSVTQTEIDPLASEIRKIINDLES